LPLLAFSRRVKLTKLRLFVKKNDKIGWYCCFILW
jgi:hypothetical protein